MTNPLSSGEPQGEGLPAPLPAGDDLSMYDTPDMRDAFATMHTAEQDASSVRRKFPWKTVALIGVLLTVVPWIVLTVLYK